MNATNALIGGLLVALAFVATHGGTHGVTGGGIAVTYRAGMCRAVDGDTLNCQGDRIRLNGIDAPEMPGHCRPGRDCAPGNPYDSRVSLASQIIGGIIVIPIKRDRYGRTVATVKTTWGDDLSCVQLRRGEARYVERWDEGRRLGDSCRSAQ